MEKKDAQNGPERTVGKQRAKKKPREQGRRLEADTEVILQRFVHAVGEAFAEAVKPTARPRAEPPLEAVKAAKKFGELVSELAFPVLPALPRVEDPGAGRAGQAAQAPPAATPAEQPPRVGQQA
jgi:hypothetical protein